MSSTGCRVLLAGMAGRFSQFAVAAAKMARDDAKLQSRTDSPRAHPCLAWNLHERAR